MVLLGWGWIGFVWDDGDGDGDELKVEQSIIECGDEDYGRGRDLMGPSLFLHSHSDDDDGGDGDGYDDGGDGDDYYEDVDIIVKGWH